MEHALKDAERLDRALTPGQLRILDHFSTIQAELECLVRETKRTLKVLHKGKHDG